MGDSPNERYWLEVLRKEYAIFADRLSFIWLNNMSFPDILTKAAALPAHSAIFFFLMNVDAAGVSYDGDTAMRSLSAVANAPMFTHDDTYFLDGGIVGGPMHSFVNTSRHAVAVALRILGGEKPGDIKAAPVRFAPPKFDWREVRRWGVSESRLPAGSEIYFRDPTLWDQYRLQILAICAAMLVQAGLICWLVFEHRRRHLAELQSRNAMTELTYMNRMSTAGQLSASIAHEISQPLTGITTRASAGLRWLRAETPNLEKAGAAFEQIVIAGHRAGDIITSVRAMFKRDTGEKLPVDTNGIIRTVLAIVRIDLEKNGVELQTELDESVSVVEGNKVQLQQVVLNLVMQSKRCRRRAIAC
jgi:hypothetical protein